MHTHGSFEETPEREIQASHIEKDTLASKADEIIRKQKEENQKI